jgi:hypothetical protein
LIRCWRKGNDGEEERRNRARDHDEDLGRDGGIMMIIDGLMVGSWMQGFLDLAWMSCSHWEESHNCTFCFRVRQNLQVESKYCSIENGVQWDLGWSILLICHLGDKSCLKVSQLGYGLDMVFVSVGAIAQEPL